jgi:hypothetical protein
MNRKGTGSIAEPIAQLQGELEEYRRMQPRRAKLPESIWEAAAELARAHGVHAVAQALRLDYMGLKRRLGGEVARRGPNKSKPVFVELIAPPPAKCGECLIELESTSGDKMRIHWPVRVAPDWTALLRAWRGTEQ